MFQHIIERINRMEEKIMSALTDLQAVVTSIQTDVATLLTNQTAQEAELASVSTSVQTTITLLQSLQSGNTNPDDPAVEAAVAQLQAADASLKSIGSSMGSDTATLTGLQTSLGAADAPPAVTPAPVVPIAPAAAVSVPSPAAVASAQDNVKKTGTS